MWERRCTLEVVEAEAGTVLRREVTNRVYGLYFIVDPEVTDGRDPIAVAAGALKGGAMIIQLRDKLRDKGQSLSTARALKELCEEYDSLFIVNDHADLAAIVDADGLHVGQGDLPVEEARRVLKPQQIIGRSNYLPKEALESQAQEADYVALGNVYATSTKASISSRPATGPESLRKAKEGLTVPLVAIGGINEDNVGPVVAAGADAICVSSAVGLAPDPEEASRRLVERIREAGGRA